jgi:carboxyl-terminal processing protease
MKLARGRPRGQLAQFGNLPPLHFWVETRTIKPNIGYMRFNLFFEPDSLIAAFQQAVKACRNCDGFIIDLRGNPGGIGGLATGVAGWFTDKQGQRLGSMFLRGASIKFAVFPRAEPFLGPLAILVDGCSASTSEIFAGGMKDLGRARIIGTRTAGAALPSVFTRLPNGDGFQYAIANYISEGGQPLEGFGVTPDQEVKLTRHQLLDGQDPVLDAAVSWIEQPHQ